MEVGLVIYGSLNTLSGGYLYDRKLVEHLRESGDNVQIISLPWRGYLRHFRDNFSRSLSEKLAHLEVDVLVQDELNHPSLVWLNRQLRQRVSYPIISLVHLLRFTEPRPAWQNQMYRFIEQEYFKTVDALIYNSADSRTLVETLGIGDKPALIAFPGGDQLTSTLTDSDLTARSFADGPLRLLFLGNVIHRKGLHILFEALKALPVGSWQLDIVGRKDMEPGYTASLVALASSSESNQSITFHGPRLDDALLPFFENSHVLVLPSLYEGFGIVYLEGMAFGLPALATHAGAAGEIIQDGISGFLLPAGDARALSNVIRSLSEDRAGLLSMSLAARRRFAQFPTWEQSMDSIRQFLLHLIQTHKKNPEHDNI